MLTNDDDVVKKRWKEYFNQLFEQGIFKRDCRGCFVECNSDKFN